MKTIYELYDSPWCPYCIKVKHATSDRSDLTCKDIAQREHRTFLLKHGDEQVPALWADGRMLYESEAIIRYLKEHPEEVV